MRLLLHTCCGPCLIYPSKYLRKKGFEVSGYFYNPNIHPFKEFKRRLNTLQDFSHQEKIPLEVEKDYDLNSFFHKIVFHEDRRCEHCYTLRLEKSVFFAKRNGFSTFTTTLLYSKYQKHSVIKKICENLGDKYDIDFFYHDFREGWQFGIDESIAKDLYRQPYCGCIYSEQERYDNRLKKKFKKKINMKD